MIRPLMIAMTVFLALQTQASFEENARRYMSAQEVIKSLSIFFVLPSQCQKINQTNASLLGLNSAISGNPVSPSPTQGTVQWISNCVDSALSNTSTDSVSSEAWNNLLSIDGANQIKKLANHDSIGHSLAFLKWAQLTEEQCVKIIEHMTYAFLGSDMVIADFGLITDPSAFRLKLLEWTKNKPNLTAKEAVKFLSLNLILRDEFLSY